MDTKHDFYQVSLKLILKNDKNEILALNGLAGGSYEGFYDLPGGRIEFGEFTTPFSEVLNREVKEEIGDIKYSLNVAPVAVGRHLLRAAISKLPEDVHILCLFFEAKYISGDIKTSSEHSEFKWFNLSKTDPVTLFKSGILEGIKMYLNKQEK